MLSPDMLPSTLILSWLLIKYAIVVYGTLTTSPNDGIHSAYVVGEGCKTDDTCRDSECKIEMDGQVHKHLIKVAEEFGFYFVTFKFPEFTKIEDKVFRTYHAANVAPMVTWINGLPDGTIVLVCSRDDATKGMDAAGWAALESIGMVDPKKVYRSSHALIGYKGKWPKMMTKSKTELTGKVEVRYTYVIPPPKIEPFIQGTSLEITWKKFGTYFTNYVIHANNSLGTGVGDYKQIVNAADERAVIGPLRGNTWYTVTMQVPLDSDSDQVIAQSDPYFIIVHGSTGCSKGIYKFIAKIDGRKDTWKQNKGIWTNNNIRFPEANALTGFDNVEAKSALYYGLKCKWICAGMRDLNTYQFNFTQTSPQTLLQSFDDWNQLDTNSNYVKAGPSAWTALFNHGILSPSEQNKEAFDLDYVGTKARYGIIMNSKTLVGYGLKFTGGSYLSAGTFHKDNNGQTVKTIGFGYILVPWYVDSIWLPWSPWNACSKTCATGTKTRNRNSTRAIGEGTQLPATAVDTGSCKIAECIPRAPGNVIVSTIAKKQLKIQWDAVPSAELSNTLDHYEYHRWKALDPASITTEKSYLTGNTVIKNIYALEIYTEYCFQVNIILKGNLPGRIGNKSDSVCAYTDEDVPIAPPSSINVSTHTWECLLVNWTAIPTPKAQGIITKYHIYYKLASGGSEMFRSTTSNNSYQLCGLLPYTEYKVQMSGFTSKGEGVSSAYSLPVRTGEYIPSKAPSIITKEHTSSTSIKVKWQALQLLDWRGIPLGYTAYYMLDDIYMKTGTRYNVSSFSVPHADLEAELTGLEKYREYVIWMAAYTVVGHGSMNSSAIKQMTDEDIPSRGPTGTTAHNSSSFSILAEWTELEIPYRLGILTQYTIFIKNLKTGVEVTKTITPPVTSGDINGLLPYLNHSVEIAASTSKGMGPRGTPAYTLTDEYIPADPPPNFRGVNISSYDLLLTWSHIPDDKWRGIPLGYTIMFRETSSSISVWNTSVVHGKNNLSTVIRGLTAYTNHTLRIAGFTIKGNGNFSDDIVVITAEDPPYEPPEEFQAAEVNSTTAVFQWKKPPNDKVKGVLRGYKIMYTTVYIDEDFVSQLLVKKAKRRRRSAVVSLPIVRNQINITVGPNQYQIELKNLQGYTNYSVQILAITLHEGMASPPTYIFTGETVPAMSPMNVTGKATTYTAILVKWKHMLPAYAHGIIRGYVVYYEHGNHSEAIAFNDTQVPNREYLEITHLKIFAWYTFQVAAHTTPGLGPKSTPIYVRTNEYLPFKAPDNVTAQSFMLPHDIDVTWAPLPLKYWNGIPLGYKVVLSAMSMGGVPLAKAMRFSYVQMISPHLTKCSFKNLTSFYKFGVQVNAYTKIGDGPASPLKSVETCKVANAVLYSSWIDHSPLVSNNPGSAIPSGFLPQVLSAALRHCSGQCIGLNIKGNAVIDYVKDGKGNPSRKRDLDELMKTMSDDTEFFFPVMKPSYANEKYLFIEIMKMEKVVVVEGEPLVNTVGGNVASSVKSLLPVLLVFVMFCFASGCVVWVMETWNRTGQFQLPTIAGVFEGFYWAWVTATTVGYGDITPASVIGKIFAMFWSIMGLILLGFLSGALSTVLTASENPIAKPSPPKTGVGMVLDTWEFAVAQKKGMNVDMNFTSYSILLDAVGNGTIRYGIMDAQISKVWAPKLAKEKIGVKKALDLDAALGIYAAGNARQMFACFKTYVKEEASTILNQVQAAVDSEAAKVAKMLSVSADVTLTIVPDKPEFFSWASVTMQSYIKTGGFALLVLVIIGIVYDVIRWLRSKKKASKVIPRRARIRQRSDTFSDYGSGTSSVNVNDTQEQARRSSTINRTLSKASTHSHIYPDLSHAAQDAADNEAYEASSRPSSPLVNYNDQAPLQSNTPLDEEQQQTGDPLSRSVTPREYVEQRAHSQDGFKEVVFDTNADPDGNRAFDSKSISPKHRANSFADTSSLLAALVADLPSKPDMTQPEMEMEQPEMNKPETPLPLESDIYAFSIGGYYDNQLLEEVTEKSIAEFEENFETMMKSLEEKHDKEREKLQTVKAKWIEQTYGGKYKYWDPTEFSAPW